MKKQNPIKRIAKRALRQYNSNRIIKLEKLLAKAVSGEENKSDIDRKICEKILKLDERFREDNSCFLQPLHIYFAVLGNEAKINIDTSTEDSKLDCYTQFFLEEKNKLLEVFKKADMQKIIMMLIVANLNLHRVRKAEEFLNDYFGIFTYYYKTMLYRRILGCSCGTLSLEKYVIPLFRAFPEEVGNYEKNLNALAGLLKNMFFLQYHLLLPLEGWEGYFRSFFKKTMGCYTDTIYSFYHQLLMHKEKVDEVNQWLQSLSLESVEQPQQNPIRKDISIAEQLIAGEKQIARTYIRAESEGEQKIWHNVNMAIADKQLDKREVLARICDAIDKYKKRAKRGRLEEQLLYANRRSVLSNHKRAFEFWATFEDNLQKITSDEIRSEVVFFVDEYSLVNAALAFPVLMECKKRGMQIVPTSPRMWKVTSESGDNLAELAGTITGDIDQRFEAFLNTESDYEIDIPHKKIIVRGLNVYQPIFEFVSRYQFTYLYHYETDAWARYRTHILIRTYDRLFRYIEEIEKWADSNHRKVYFLSNAPHIHNAAAFRIYCEERGHQHGLNYVCIASGYDNYFKNIGDSKTETITALNLTANPNSRNSFLGTQTGFEKYFVDNIERLEIIKKTAAKLFNFHRGDEEKSASLKKQEVLAKIESHKKRGGSVYLLNGKVIFDLGVKSTQGCVYGDMSEWITKTIEFVKKSQNILLLIKPHPHEQRPDLTLTSEQTDTLKDIIKTDLGSNTILLDKDLFRIAELTPYIDLGLLWNGTSAVEFAAQGIPTLIGDVWGYYDYPIGFVRPKTVAEYEQYLDNPALINTPEDLADKALMFLDYMGSNAVCVGNPYSSTTTLNFNQFASKINEDAVQKYIIKGDCQLKELVDSFL